MSRFETCVEVILTQEGGAVDHPNDPGGATNMGITHETLGDWRGEAVTKADVFALTRSEAKRIYRARYWDKLKCDDLPVGVDLVAFDFGVNAGVSRSGRYLQRAVGADIDGKVGPQTLEAVAVCDPRTLIARLTAARLDYYRGLRTYDTFGTGWEARSHHVARLGDRDAAAADLGLLSGSTGNAAARGLDDVLADLLAATWRVFLAWIKGRRA